MRKAILITLLGLVCGACASSENPSPQPTPTPDDPATRAARAEEKFQGSGSRRGQLRTEARNAVTDFVKSSLPGWTVKGISSQHDDIDGFSMDADLERQGHHIVLTFEVRKFFPESGEAYWLAVPVNKFRLDRLHALTDADLKRQLEEAQSQLQEAQSQLEERPDSPDEP